MNWLFCCLLAIARVPFSPPPKRAQGFDVVRYRRSAGSTLTVLRFSCLPNKAFCAGWVDFRFCWFPSLAIAPQKGSFPLGGSCRRQATEGRGICRAFGEAANLRYPHSTLRKLKTLHPLWKSTLPPCGNRSQNPIPIPFSFSTRPFSTPEETVENFHEKAPFCSHFSIWRLILPNHFLYPKQENPATTAKR